MAKPTLERIRGRVGIWTPAHESVAPAESGAVIGLAEELGYCAYWYPESSGREALVSGALLTQATSEIVVGSAIASIWARDAVAAINGARTLAASSHDRFVLGLGVSHQPLVEGLRGHHYDKPLSAMRSYLAAMEGVTMRSPEKLSDPPVMIAALGPGMLRLAAEFCDGALPYLVTPEHTARARETMGKDAFLAVEQAVALTDDAATFSSLAATHLEMYTGLPNYYLNWQRLGFDESDFVRGGSPRLQEALVAHGDEAAIYQRIDEHFAAGADHVSIQILGSDFAHPPFDAWRRLSPKAVGR